MTPEDQLCLSLARVRPSPEDERRARELLAAQPTWGTISRARAGPRRVFPLVYRNLQRMDFPGVPEIALELQANRVKANRSRNLLLVQELTRLLAKQGYRELF